MVTFAQAFKGVLIAIGRDYFVQVTDACECKQVKLGSRIPVKGRQFYNFPKNVAFSFLFTGQKARLLNDEDFELLRKDWKKEQTQVTAPRSTPPKVIRTKTKPAPPKPSPPNAAPIAPPKPKPKATTVVGNQIEQIRFPRRKGPWQWQEEAFEKWRAKKFRGTVEAATGTGKTYLGLDAIDCYRKIQKAHNRNAYCLIVVPSVYLLNQWYDRLRAHFPSIRIARRGDGYKETFAQGSICVATVQSLVGVGKRPADAPILELFAFTEKDRASNATLLIADECHHYSDSAPVFALIKKLVEYDAVLALSATVDENDEDSAVFGKVIYRYPLSKAIQSGTVAQPRIWNIPCSLQIPEQNRYSKLSEEIEKQRVRVIQTHPELYQLDYGDENFFAALRRIDEDAGPDGDPSIRKLFTLYFQRASILYTAAEKQKAAGALLKRLLTKRRKVIVFFERISSAKEVKQSLDTALDLVKAVRKHSGDPIGTWVLHSGMTEEDKERSLKLFNDSKSGALFCCNMVNEGYDLPDIEVAVIVASTKSERQRIQRVGRIVRRGARNKKPLVLTLYCEGTSDAEIVMNDRAIFGKGVDISKKSMKVARSGISALY